MTIDSNMEKFEVGIGIRRFYYYGDGHSSDVGYSRGGTIAATDDCVFDEILSIFNSLCREPGIAAARRARLGLPTGPVTA